jgi:hypothetical protein
LDYFVEDKINRYGIEQQDRQNIWQLSNLLSNGETLACTCLQLIVIKEYQFYKYPLR